MDTTKDYSKMTPSERSEAKEYADTILRADYYRSVRETAEDIKMRIVQQEITDRDALTEAIDEAADSSHRATYTYAHFQCLRYSEHDRAYVDEFGGEGVVKDGAVNWGALAYAAFRADVIDWLESINVDVNNNEMVDFSEVEKGPGKFEGEVLLCRALYNSGADEEADVGDGFGWYGLYLDIRPEDMGGRWDAEGFIGAAILHESENGFVSATYYASNDDAERAWGKIVKEIEGEQEDEEAEDGNTE